MSHSVSTKIAIAEVYRKLLQLIKNRYIIFEPQMKIDYKIRLTKMAKHLLIEKQHQNLKKSIIRNFLQY